MFKYESNIDEVKHHIHVNIDNLIDKDKALRTACLDAIVLISDRVQQRGENTEGEKMVTKSTEKEGSYSRKYGKRRDKNGLQTDIIDLTFSGDMMNDFTFAPDGETSYIVGFRGKESSDKADYNEMRFGTIFQLSDKESKIVLSSITKK